MFRPNAVATSDRCNTKTSKPIYKYKNIQNAFQDGDTSKNTPHTRTPSTDNLTCNLYFNIYKYHVFRT